MAKIRSVGKKRASQATARKACYALLRQILSLRDGERCFRCGKTERLQMSHIYPKGRYRSMEMEPYNLQLLCVVCHLFWWHKNPVEAHEWLQAVWPKEWLSRLKLMSQTNSKLDLGLQRLFLEDELKKLL